MEPPKGFLATLWNFICFLPYFIGLLLLGNIKGIIFCPLICLIMTIGNSCIILGLFPLHGYWTCYSIVRAKILGPFLKLIICLCLPALLILWLVVGIVGSIIGGILYGFLSPIFATFDAVGEGKTNVFFHCFYDGTWSTITGSCTVVRDFRDFVFYSYMSFMEELRQKEGPPNGKYYEIRFLYLPPALIAAVLGIMVDFPVISLVAMFKSPYMLFKGWHRLFHDLIGREGPFLETICVPFAGLAILLWPLAVIGAVLGSMVSSIFLGAYAGVVVYQESSFWFGLCYIVASLSIYDEYSNDVLDMPEGSCFARPQYRRFPKESISNSSSFSKSDSFKPRPPARMDSITNERIDLKPRELLEGLFKECLRHGEKLVSEGLITPKDIEEAKSSKGTVVSIGLPAYCLLEALLRSVNNNKVGIMLSDNTEITATNRPKDKVFDWFLNPFLIIKEQIKAENLSEEEEDYLRNLVLLCGDPERLKSSNIGSPPESERKQAELDALARRLQGITKSISRYPTFRRQFENLVKKLLDDLAKRNGGSGKSSNGAHPISRSKSAGIIRIFSNKSFKRNTSYNNSDLESQSVTTRDIDIA